jgi:hypothetical protein
MKTVQSLAAILLILFVAGDDAQGRGRLFGRRCQKQRCCFECPQAPCPPSIEETLAKLGPPDYSQVTTPAIVAVSTNPTLAKVVIPPNRVIIFAGSDNFGLMTKALQIKLVRPDKSTRIVYQNVVMHNHVWPGMENDKLKETFQEGDILEVRFLQADDVAGVPNPKWHPSNPGAVWPCFTPSFGGYQSDWLYDSIARVCFWPG